jgi:hypothetical protein
MCSNPPTLYSSRPDGRKQAGEIATCPSSPGQSIEFTLVLEHIDPERPVRLKCLGEIIRVEDSGQKIGVAAAINSYTFEEIRQ